jgi:FkbM family methyltransferase
VLQFKNIENIFNGDKKIFLWGAGPNVKSFVNEYCYKKKIFDKPLGIIETKRKVVNGQNFIENLPFVSLEEVYKVGYDNCIIIITAGLIDLYSEVIKNELFYYKIVHKKSIEFWEYFKSNKISFSSILENLYDEKSKSVYINRLQNVIDGNFLDTNLFDVGPYFNNDLITSPVNEKINNFLYAGAFNGKHLDRFVDNNKNVGGGIYAFEPSIRMYNFLVKKYHLNKKITIKNNLLWNKNEKIKFNDDEVNNGLGASVTKNKLLGKNYFVIGCKIDSLIDVFKADLVALDVEGSEMMAIEGGKSYIEKYLPHLAICIYHNPGDYHKIIEYMIYNYQKKYNFFVRQHSAISYIETVLYCLPKKT